LFLLVWLSLVSLGAYAQVAPTETEASAASPAELTIYSSNANSVLVNVLNLTPYDMTYDPGSSTLYNQMDRDRNAKKSFTFAPVGIPGIICGTGFYPTLQIVEGKTKVKNLFSPAYHTLPECLERLQDATGSVVAPVPFIISWNDNDEMVEHTQLTWTMHDVICDESARLSNPGEGCVEAPDFDGFSTYKADIDLGLWFHRSGTEKPEIGMLFRSSMETVLSTAELVEGFENPYRWKAAYLAMKELAENMNDFEEWNLGDYTGARMTVSSYPFPREGSLSSECFQDDPPCTPQAMSEGANDNVMLQWATGYTNSAGAAEASVVVITQVLRGHDAHNNEYYEEIRDQQYLRCCNFRIGSLTTVNVTIMIPNQVVTTTVTSVATTSSPSQLRHVLLSNGFGRIRQYLLRHGREGALALWDVVESLPPAEARLLLQAARSTLTGQTRKEEEEVLRTVAKALDKHP